MTKTTTELAPAEEFLAFHTRKGQHLLCAVSGGLDSMCLLHLLATWGRERGLAVTAAHFNHQLRFAESDRDEAFVRGWCAEHDVPFVSGSGDVRRHADETGKTVEEAARDLRYAFLAEQKRLLGCTFILTAHHADDNAETMLLHLLRGSGARGLAGIPERRGDIARPFLGHTREELTAYAETYHIKYVEDSTNALDDASRNLLRHKVLPVLRELNPKAVENMARAAMQLRRDEEALSRMAETLLKSSCHGDGSSLRIDAASCLGAEPAVRTRAVYEAVARMAGHQKDLTARHVEAVCELLRSSAGKELSLPYGLTARREAEVLVIEKTDLIPEKVRIHLGETVAFGRWQVRLDENGPGWKLALPDGAEVTVTPWDRNDSMTLPGSRGARSLKRILSERGVSPAEREGLPVLRVGGKCAAVPFAGTDREFLSGESRTAFVNFQFQTEENDDEK